MSDIWTEYNSKLFALDVAKHELEKYIIKLRGYQHNNVGRVTNVDALKMEREMRLNQVIECMDTAAGCIFDATGELFSAFNGVEDASKG